MCTYRFQVNHSAQEELQKCRVFEPNEDIKRLLRSAEEARLGVTGHHWLPSSGWVIVGRAHHLHYYIGQQNEGVYDNEGGQVEQYRRGRIPILAHEHIELLV